MLIEPMCVTYAIFIGFIPTALCPAYSKHVAVSIRLCSCLLQTCFLNPGTLKECMMTLNFGIVAVSADNVDVLYTANIRW